MKYPFTLKNLDKVINKTGRTETELMCIVFNFLETLFHQDFADETPRSKFGDSMRLIVHVGPTSPGTLRPTIDIKRMRDNSLQVGVSIMDVLVLSHECEATKTTVECITAFLDKHHPRRHAIKDTA